jgi:endonuclease YncB( thermonuclease family)
VLPERRYGIVKNRELVRLPARTGDWHGTREVIRNSETNINVAVARSGWVQVKREYIRALPASEQVALIQAEREAKTAKLGLWKEANLAEAK